jgi:CDP-6-deoxy-D-xylo-4-hexulose-3-dehydrase
LKNRIDRITNKLAKLAINSKHLPKKFVPGAVHIPVSGKMFGYSELVAAVSASLDFWLTSGPYTEIFEKELSNYIGVRNALMVNSGSSANLLAISALTSSKLGNRALLKGDEVITVAAGFPTTVAPIIQNGLTPVYVDVELETYVATVDKIKEAITSKTKAIIMAHTLGNPFNVVEVKKVCNENGIWLIEDNCDALGGTFLEKKLGSFGDISTLSFYPAHHITTGEGGAVLTNKPVLKPLLESFRDWGRDCWCAPGCDNTCAKRFDWKLGNLPAGYDHKYIYSHLGYNLKSGDIQAAIGSAQLEKIDMFVNRRRDNWDYIRFGISDLDDFFILPKATEDSKPSWFGFALTVKPRNEFTRNYVIEKLEQHKIGSRLLFGGNLINQPAFIGTPMRIIGDLKNTNTIMNNTFWIGVWPGLSKQMLDYIIEIFHNICKDK